MGLEFHLNKFTIKATVLIENSLWVVIFERKDSKGYAVARKIFGKEPTDPELYEFVLTRSNELKFTEPQEFELIIKRKNYKRMQREVKNIIEKSRKNQLNTTHAQEVLRQALEKNKKTKKFNSKIEKETREEERFRQKQEKKKKKRKGH